MVDFAFVNGYYDDAEGNTHNLRAEFEEQCIRILFVMSRKKKQKQDDEERRVEVEKRPKKEEMECCDFREMM